MAKLHPTRNNLDAGLREKMVAILDKHLASAIDLKLQTKQAHWNVRGPHFLSLHKFFDKLAEIVEDLYDKIAERGSSLGGTMHGTVRAISASTTLPPYPENISTGDDHLKALANAFATFGKGVREGIDQADELGDADTADVLTEVSREIDQQLWFIEAHLEGRE